VEYLLILALLGIIPALIARSRDPYQSFIFWWIYGAALFIIALPHAMLFRPGSKSLRRFQGGLAGPRTKKCPFCAEIVMVEARICKHCCRDMISGRSDVCAECRRPLPSGSSRCPHCHVRVTTGGESNRNFRMG